MMAMDALVEIAEIISGGDAAVSENMAACVKDPEAYYDAHAVQFQERWIEPDENPELICWMALVDELEAKEYVCERDWKDEKEDFLYFLGKLTGIKQLGLELQPDWLDEDGDISEWCAVLDEKWAGRQCCVACMDIESDSYVVFPCGFTELERLMALAEQAGRRIDLAEKM